MDTKSKRKSQHLGNRVFGAPLSDNSVKFIISIISRINPEGREGIYRVSANNSAVNEIRTLVNKGKDCDSLIDADVHTRAGLVKSFFKDMEPEPVFTYRLYSSFLGALQKGDVDEQRKNVSRLLDLLPYLHFRALGTLMSHLNAVTQHKECLMDSQNLSIVFGPILLRPPPSNSGDPGAETLGLLLDVGHVNRMVSYLIVNYDIFFQVRLERLDAYLEKVEMRRIEEERLFEAMGLSSPKGKARKQTNSSARKTVDYTGAKAEAVAAKQQKQQKRKSSFRLFGSPKRERQPATISIGSAKRASQQIAEPPGSIEQSTSWTRTAFTPRGSDDSNRSLPMVIAKLHEKDGASDEDLRRMMAQKMKDKEPEHVNGTESPDASEADVSDLARFAYLGRGRVDTVPFDEEASSDFSSPQESRRDPFENLSSDGSFSSGESPPERRQSRTPDAKRRNGANVSPVLPPRPRNATFGMSREQALAKRSGSDISTTTTVHKPLPPPPPLPPLEEIPDDLAFVLGASELIPPSSIHIDSELDTVYEPLPPREPVQHRAVHSGSVTLPSRSNTLIRSVLPSEWENDLARRNKPAVQDVDWGRTINHSAPDLREVHKTEEEVWDEAWTRLGVGVKPIERSESELIPIPPRPTLKRLPPVPPTAPKTPRTAQDEEEDELLRRSLEKVYRKNRKQSVSITRAYVEKMSEEMQADTSFRIQSGMYSREELDSWLREMEQELKHKEQHDLRLPH